MEITRNNKSKAAKSHRHVTVNILNRKAIVLYLNYYVQLRLWVLLVCLQKGTVLNKISQDNLSGPVRDGCGSLARSQGEDATKVFSQYQPPNPGPPAYGRTCKCAIGLCFRGESGCLKIKGLC